MADQFDSADQACSLTGEAFDALNFGKESQTKLYQDLANIRVGWGQGALDELGNQLESIDLKHRIQNATLGTLPYIPICEGANFTMPAILIGRDENHHVTQIAFMRPSDMNLPKDRTIAKDAVVWKNWK
jgi:hypothetical protein